MKIQGGIDVEYTQTAIPQSRRFLSGQWGGSLLYNNTHVVLASLVQSRVEKRVLTY
jgi:hypothetical protein